MLAIGRRVAARAAQPAAPGTLARRGVQPQSRQSCRASKPRRAGAPSTDGISHNIEYEGLWGAITTFPKRRPYATNIIVATVKTAMADIIVQKAEGKKDIDWDRTKVFTAFGFAYLGVAQWFVYVTVFTKLCPNAIRFSNLSWADKLKDRPGQIDLLKQTALDNFVHYTFVYFPVFYCFKEAIQAKDQEGAGLLSTIQGGCKKYWNNFYMDNIYIWSLWVPGDLVVYACPIWMRLPLNHAISLVWTMILSSLRGAEK